jgi:hypothetical protein
MSYKTSDMKANTKRRSLESMGLVNKMDETRLLRKFVEWECPD